MSVDLPEFVDLAQMISYREHGWWIYRSTFTSITLSDRRITNKSSSIIFVRNRHIPSLSMAFKKISVVHTCGFHRPRPRGIWLAKRDKRGVSLVMLQPLMWRVACSCCWIYLSTENHLSIVWSICSSRRTLIHSSVGLQYTGERA